jgi:hypothetical protein
LELNSHWSPLTLKVQVHWLQGHFAPPLEEDSILRAQP